MNRQDLIRKIAADAGLTRQQANRALDAFLAAVRGSLINGDKVTLSGFGTFVLSEHKARVVREPRRGTTIEIQARRVARFVPGLELRSAIEKALQDGHPRT